MDTVFEKQVGGTHYKDLAVQPIKLIINTNADFIQGNIIKYVVRYKFKNGLEDLLKVQHYIDFGIESLNTGLIYPRIGNWSSQAAAFISANKLSTTQGKIVIAALQKDYYSAQVYIRDLIKLEYPERASSAY